MGVTRPGQPYKARLHTTDWQTRRCQWPECSGQATWKQRDTWEEVEEEKRSSRGVSCLVTVRSVPSHLL